MAQNGSQPTALPSVTPLPTKIPTKSAQPTTIPTLRPTPVPSGEPSFLPHPTSGPSYPTLLPTPVPSGEPSFSPHPTAGPSVSAQPTVSPYPTLLPTPVPSSEPSFSPHPTAGPSVSAQPSVSPYPTFLPTPVPSGEPSLSPYPTTATSSPTCSDSATWYRGQTWKHCDWVSEKPDVRCLLSGTDGTYAYENCFKTCGCASQPTMIPSRTSDPTPAPSSNPFFNPTAGPSVSAQPTVSPYPTLLPTPVPSSEPSFSPHPTAGPSVSAQPSVSPYPTFLPTPVPSGEPSLSPYPTTATSSPTCSDSATWYRGQTWKHCDWVSEKPDVRCLLSGTDGTYAYENCFKTCGCASQPTMIPSRTSDPTPVPSSDPFFIPSARPSLSPYPTTIPTKYSDLSTSTPTGGAVVIISESKLFLSEGGKARNFTVHLLGEPVGAVSIAFHSSGPMVRAVPNVVNFTIYDFNTTQTVQVMAQEDYDYDAIDQGWYTETLHGNVTSNDICVKSARKLMRIGSRCDYTHYYENVAVPSIKVTVTDNDYKKPTGAPFVSSVPTVQPSFSPQPTVTHQPTTPSPSQSPSDAPTKTPTAVPSNRPTDIIYATAITHATIFISGFNDTLTDRAALAFETTIIDSSEYLQDLSQVNLTGFEVKSSGRRELSTKSEEVQSDRALAFDNIVGITFRLRFNLENYNYTRDSSINASYFANELVAIVENDLIAVVNETVNGTSAFLLYFELVANASFPVMTINRVDTISSLKHMTVVTKVIINTGPTMSPTSAPTYINITNPEDDDVEDVSTALASWLVVAMIVSISSFYYAMRKIRFQSVELKEPMPVHMPFNPLQPVLTTASLRLPILESSHHKSVASNLSASNTYTSKETSLRHTKSKRAETQSEKGSPRELTETQPRKGSPRGHKALIQSVSAPRLLSERKDTIYKSTKGMYESREPVPFQHSRNSGSERTFIEEDDAFKSEDVERARKEVADTLDLVNDENHTNAIEMSYETGHD
eukprot:CAMPEP_0185791624 /NCGR_PEP_ID=MMETSP1174-20130828/158479_1 /TAXON_ID=35687 /ORGANISM="Dictyocha speculum, Strain CCMP1381" /LENGTH=997 /DNA_ID=CAMNT_0028486599 /DNA_START=229 /DNA_END=3222 /DNA_ORIENTATION=-